MAGALWQVVGIRVIVDTATALMPTPGLAWNCPAGAHCVRFAVGLDWSSNVEDLSPRYVCRRWNSERGVWAKDSCAPVENTTSATWNSTDILLEDSATDATNSSGTIVECACSSDGLFTVEVLLDESDSGSDLGMYCAIPERRAISRKAIFAVAAAGIVLSLVTALMVQRPLLIVEKAYSSKNWRVLPLTH